MSFLRRDAPDWAARVPDLTFLSDPPHALTAAFRMVVEDNLLGHVGRTVLRSISAFALAAVLGGVLGWLLGRRVLFERTVLPTIEAVRAIPPVALLPVFILLAGVAESFTLALATFGTVWPITIAAYAAVKGVDPITVRVGHNLQLTRWQMARYILFPLALPGFLTGLRIALPLSLILVVVAEIFVGGGTGLGAELDYAKRSFRFDDMMAIVVTTGLVGLVMNFLMAQCERKIVWWDSRFRMGSPRP